MGYDEFFTKKTCGVIGGLFLILSLFLPITTITVTILGFEKSSAIYWKDDVLDIAIIVFIIFFYFLSVWSENKYTMIFVAGGLIWQIVDLFKEFNNTADKTSQLNLGLIDYGMQVEDGLSVSMGLGSFAFIIGTVFLIIGLIMAIRES